MTTLQLHRPNLQNIPHHPLPPGYALVPHQPHLLPVWLAIQTAADTLNTLTPRTFHDHFGTDPALHTARIHYLLAPDATPIGTSAAWFGGHGHPDTLGRVHWIAILPGHQGRGLSKPLLAHTLQTLRALGHTAAYLTTDTRRPAALHLYAAFGFQP